MTLADDLKPMAREIRGIPGELGIRPHRVFLSWRTSLGPDHIGDGGEWTTEIEFLEGGGHPPKVRRLNDEQRALGNLAAGSLMVGPVTTPHDGKGVTMPQLQGRGWSDLTALRCRVVGPSGSAFYTIKAIDNSRAIHWMLTLEPMSQPLQLGY